MMCIKKKDWTDAPGHAFLCDNPHLSTHPLLIRRLMHLKKKDIARMSIKVILSKPPTCRFLSYLN